MHRYSPRVLIVTQTTRYETPRRAQRKPKKGGLFERPHGLPEKEMDLNPNPGG